MSEAMSCNSLTILRNCIILRSFWLSVLQRTRGWPEQGFQIVPPKVKLFFTLILDKNKGVPWMPRINDKMQISCHNLGNILTTESHWNNQTNNRRNCLDINKSRLFQIGTNFIKVRTKLFNSGIGGEKKLTPVSVNIVANPWKFIHGFPLWFLVINFKSASGKVRTH